MFQILIILILTIMNAFFAAAEMAMVSVNRNKLNMMAEEGHKKAKMLIKLLDEPSKFLATIQVGITLAGFFSSAFAATGLSEGLGMTLASIGIPYGDQLAIVLITIALSFVMLLFGELFPKRLALQRAEAIAMFSIKPIFVISKIASPFVKLLSRSTNLLLRIFGVNQEGLEQKVSEEEIRSLVKVGQESGVINKIEKQMINSIFEFDDKLAREVMTPRMDVKMVDVGAEPKVYISELVQLKYSRIPVYNGDKDQPKGIIHLKDILVEAKAKGFEHMNIEDLIRPAYFVPETIPIDRLFIQLQRERKHMALLMDEHGLMTGIVTMEDLIEEVMGNIEDEFDDTLTEIQALGDNSFSVQGGLPIFDFNDVFHTKIESDRADTIGGYLVSLEGLLPSELVGKTLLCHGLSFEVKVVSEERIETLIVKKLSTSATIS